MSLYPRLNRDSVGRGRIHEYSLIADFLQYPVDGAGEGNTEFFCHIRRLAFGNAASQLFHFQAVVVGNLHDFEFLSAVKGLDLVGQLKPKFTEEIEPSVP